MAADAHVRRYHRHYRGSGHVWQGRFKAFPIGEDEHLWTVLRYVERNALRANLVRGAELWAWSSAAALAGGAMLRALTPVPCRGVRIGWSGSTVRRAMRSWGPKRGHSTFSIAKGGVWW